MLPGLSPLSGLKQLDIFLFPPSFFGKRRLSSLFSHRCGLIRPSLTSWIVLPSMASPPASLFVSPSCRLIASPHVAFRAWYVVLAPEVFPLNTLLVNYLVPPCGSVLLWHLAGFRLVLCEGRSLSRRLPPPPLLAYMSLPLPLQPPLSPYLVPLFFRLPPPFPFSIYSFFTSTLLPPSPSFFHLPSPPLSLPHFL